MLRNAIYPAAQFKRIPSTRLISLKLPDLLVRARLDIVLIDV